MDDRDPSTPAGSNTDGATRHASPSAGQRSTGASGAAAAVPLAAGTAATVAMNGALPAAADRAAVSPASDDPLVGTIVADRYRLERKLGEGGMGTVYRGEHLTLKKPVAVKFLHRDLSSNKELVARFEREAVAAAHLDHPNVVAATDFGRTAEGEFFLVMEYVEGQQLRRVLQHGGPMPTARALGILRQISAALARAHSRGVVHRDLKPENVVVCERGLDGDLVKVIDFGIARMTPGGLAGPAPALTQVGAVFGTPEYMAPEQAMGQQVDARADQYALGVIAFELLAGRRPFHADDAIDLLRMHVGQPPPLLSSMVPGLPPAMDGVLARMLAKRPEARFESVGAAWAAIESAFGLSATGIVQSANYGLAPVGLPAALEPSLQGTPSPTGLDPGFAGPAASGGGSAPMRRPLAWLSPAALRAPGGPLADPRARLGLGLVVAVLGVLVLVSVMVAASQRRARSTRAREAGAVAARLQAYQRTPDVAEAISRSLRGDSAGAIRRLAARRARHPDDGLAAYFLGTAYWTGRRPADAVEQFRAALSAEPALAEDATLCRAVAGALGAPSAADAAEALLRSSLLSGSSVAAQAVADEALEGLTVVGRTRALGVASGMSTLLPRLERARVMLRVAESCADMAQALRELRAVGGPIATEESNAVRAGDCSGLRLRDCAACAANVPRSE